MDRNRRSVRHLEPKDDSNRTPTGGSSRTPTGNSFRASTIDSGRGSMVTTERSTLDSRSDTGISSSLSRDTPINDHEHATHKEYQNDKPVRIHPTSVLGKKCYEQAYVSYVDHPSAFFLQLSHFEQQYKELHQEINEFYSKNPMTNPSLSRKRGDYCIAKYNDNEFYRARIIAVPEVTNTRNLYHVVFLDYGNWNKVVSSDIHTLLPKFAILTAQAIPCSLTKSLPPTPNGDWFDHPRAIKLFEDLVLDQYVDATFQLRAHRDFWPLTFVDLELSSSKLNVRKHMINEKLIRDVTNEQIYLEFNHLFKPVDYIIYSIAHEDEENDDD